MISSISILSNCFIIIRIMSLLFHFYSYDSLSNFYIWYIMFYLIEIQYISLWHVVIKIHNFLLFNNAYISERNHILMLFSNLKINIEQQSTSEYIWSYCAYRTRGSKVPMMPSADKTLRLRYASTSRMLWEEKSFFNFTFFSVNHPWKKPIFEGHKQRPLERRM